MQYSTFVRKLYSNLQSKQIYILNEKATSPAAYSEIKRQYNGVKNQLVSLILLSGHP